MTTTDKIARRKLSLLDLASELSNVSRACKVMGYSRQQFYEIRRNVQTHGARSPDRPTAGREGAAPQPGARRNRGGGARPCARSSQPWRAVNAG
jgi:hypothetical protein